MRYRSAPNSRGKCHGRRTTIRSSLVRRRGDRCRDGEPEFGHDPDADRPARMVDRRRCGHAGGAPARRRAVSGSRYVEPRTNLDHYWQGWQRRNAQGRLPHPDSPDRDNVVVVLRVLSAVCVASERRCRILSCRSAIDMQQFYNAFLPTITDRCVPDISPLYADLKGLCLLSSASEPRTHCSMIRCLCMRAGSLRETTPSWRSTPAERTASHCSRIISQGQRQQRWTPS
jgi:hypothetical protein